MARSVRAQKEPGRSAAGCADRYTMRVTWRAASLATWGARAAVTSAEVNGQSRNSASAPRRPGSREAGSARSADTASVPSCDLPGRRLSTRTFRSRSLSWATTWRPTRPVPPVTTIIEDSPGRFRRLTVQART